MKNINRYVFFLTVVTAFGQIQDLYGKLLKSNMEEMADIGRLIDDLTAVDNDLAKEVKSRMPRERINKHEFEVLLRFLAGFDSAIMNAVRNEIKPHQYDGGIYYSYLDLVKRIARAAMLQNKTVSAANEASDRIYNKLNDVLLYLQDKAHGYANRLQEITETAGGRGVEAQEFERRFGTEWNVVGELLAKVGSVHNRLFNQARLLNYLDGMRTSINNYLRSPDESYARNANYGWHHIISEVAEYKDDDLMDELRQFYQSAVETYGHDVVNKLLWPVGE